MDNKTAEAADQCGEPEFALVAPVQPGKTDKHVGDAVVKQHRLPVDGTAAGEEKLQCAENEAYPETPSETPAESCKDQRNHNQVD